MTREHVKALLPVLHAYAEGKEILVNGRPACRPIDLDFNCRPWEYSIKPDPMEIEILVTPNGQLTQVIQAPYCPAEGWTKKRFREVLE